MSEVSTSPRMGTVEHRLWRFALIANKTSLHPLDWKRYYQFIAFAHQRRVGWGAEHVQKKLREYGFDQQHAMDLASAYWHGRCALFVNKPRQLTDSHHKWLNSTGIPWT